MPDLIDLAEAMIDINPVTVDNKMAMLHLQYVFSLKVPWQIGV